MKPKKKQNYHKNSKKPMNSKNPILQNIRKKLKKTIKAETTK